MRVNSVTLEYYRNYLSARAEFHPGMNIICGDNAQGKTNLLEAVAYLSAARSHRARYDRELILFGVEHGFITGEISCRGRDYTVEIALNTQGRRQITRNGVRLKKAGELGETLNTVLFCPRGSYLIRAGAAERRRFLDDTISQLRPKYAEALERYQKVLKAKSFILRNQEERPDLLDTLDDFSLQLCQTGAVVTHYRAYFIRRLNEIAPAIHREFSGGAEALSLRYEPDSAVTDPLARTRTDSGAAALPSGGAAGGGAGRPAVPGGPPPGRAGGGYRRPPRPAVCLPGPDPHRRPEPEAGPAGYHL